MNLVRVTPRYLSFLVALSAHDQIAKILLFVERPFSERLGLVWERQLTYLSQLPRVIGELLVVTDAHLGLKNSSP